MFNILVCNNSNFEYENNLNFLKHTFDILNIRLSPKFWNVITRLYYYVDYRIELRNYLVHIVECLILSVLVCA